MSPETIFDSLDRALSEVENERLRSGLLAKAAQALYEKHLPRWREALERAIQTASGIAPPIHRGFAHVEIGLAAQACGCPDKAEQCLIEAERVYRDHRPSPVLPTLYLQVIDGWACIGHTDNATALLELEEERWQKEALAAVVKRCTIRGELSAAQRLLSDPRLDETRSDIVADVLLRILKHSVPCQAAQLRELLDLASKGPV